jgi:hypothetical protein
MQAAEEILPNPPLPEALREASQRGKLIPFIGAGASKLAGCPNWSDFADASLRFFVDKGKFTYNQLEQLRSLSPRVRLSLALALQEEHQLKIKFEEILHPDGELINPVGRRLYACLSQLGRIFVTTNYDGWLDRRTFPEPASLLARPTGATPAVPEARNIVYNVSEITPDLLSKDNTVIHLHGSIRAPEGMILSTQHYVKHYANDRRTGQASAENPVLRFLEFLFNERTVLFVGYGLEELEILEYVILKAGQARESRPTEARHFLLQGFFSHEKLLYRSLSDYYLRVSTTNFFDGHSVLAGQVW